MKTIKLKCGHDMDQDTFANRVEFLWEQLEADGMEVSSAFRGDADCDIEINVDEYTPGENFRKALAMGRYKLDVKRVDNRSKLKINLC